jgi:hypothetical protein
MRCWTALSRNGVTAVAKIGADTLQLWRNLGTTTSWEPISAALAKAQKWTLRRVSEGHSESSDIFVSPKRVGAPIYSHHELEVLLQYVPMKTKRSVIRGSLSSQLKRAYGCETFTESDVKGDCAASLIARQLSRTGPVSSAH